MRSYQLLLYIFLLTSGFNLQGQSISNSGFEDWSTIQYYEDPDGYTTTNVITYFGGDGPNVTKSTDSYSGSYALRLETINSADGIIEGAAFIGQPGGGTFTGGIPYDERPDSLTGYVKYDVAENDTAYVAAVFKKFGVPIGISFGQFTGVQSEYIYFSVQVEWLVPIISPDTLAIALISSSIFTEPIAGNVLYVDNVAFVGPGDPFPNGDFENWTELSAEEPDNWQSSNIFSLPVSSASVNKTTDSHSGNYAVTVESQPTNWDTLGFITNGNLDEDGPTGGMPVEDIPAILSGYYKYYPTGPDTAVGRLVLYHYNNSTGETDVLDTASLKLPAADNYTYFELEVDYYSLPEPDTVNIAFGSGNIENPGAYIGMGSTLYLDDLNITYKPSIVSVNDHLSSPDVKVYPNPVRETLNFELINALRGPVKLEIYNSNGKLVISRTDRNSSELSVKVSSLSPGIYFYKLSIGSSLLQDKFLVE